MFYNEEDKIFSLKETSKVVPYDNVKKLLEEFFYYLFLAGLYVEGSQRDIYISDSRKLSDEGPYYSPSCYDSAIGDVIFKNLKFRILRLKNHRDVNDFERTLIDKLDNIFSPPKNVVIPIISAKDIISVAVMREFDEGALVVCKYLSRMFGQYEFGDDVTVPFIEMSKFGDIYIPKFRPSDFRLGVPSLKYNQLTKTKDEVTGLWSLVSSIDVFSMPYGDNKGNFIVDFLANLSFISRIPNGSGQISLPRYFSAIYFGNRFFGENNEGFITDCYRKLVFSDMYYSSSDKFIEIIRQPLLLYILDLMMDKLSIRSMTELFSDIYRPSIYLKSTLKIKTVPMPEVLKYAIESLDGDGSSTDTSDNIDSSSQKEEGSDETQNEDDDKNLSTNSDSGGENPEDDSVDDTANTVNTIGIISFDKEGEGINENLLRLAIVSLNERIQNQGDLDISPDNKSILQYWVNGFLYRTSIKTTIMLLKKLEIFKYLPKVL